MRPPDQVKAVLELSDTGLTTTQIARVTGIPRTTIRDWRAGHIPERFRGSDVSCEECGQPAHRFEELPASYPYLLGLYLGDGSIARHPRGVFKLRINLDASYPGIVSECTDAMREVMPSSGTNTWLRKYGDVEVYSYAKSWPCLFPQHGPGPKHRRDITLTGWQRDLVTKAPQLLLRGLIHSDGCRFQNTGRKWIHPRYSFRNSSDDIRRIFCDACDLLGVRWTGSERTVYVSRTVDVATLDSFIGPKA